MESSLVAARLFARENLIVHQFVIIHNLIYFTVSLQRQRGRCEPNSESFDIRIHRFCRFVIYDGLIHLVRHNHRLPHQDELQRWQVLVVMIYSGAIWNDFIPTYLLRNKVLNVHTHLFAFWLMSGEKAYWNSNFPPQLLKGFFGEVLSLSLNLFWLE